MVVRKANIRLAKRYLPASQRKAKEVVRNERATRINVLQDAYNAWIGLDAVRRKAERNKRFVFDDQWGDKIPNPDGCGWITERQHIIEQGNVPMQNNRIRGIVRSVSGVFQGTQTEPVCVARDRKEQQDGEVMGVALQYVYQLNRLWSLDSLNLIYFLVSGFGIFKSSWGWRNEKMDVWNDLIPLNYFFVDNQMKDPRHWDCQLVGELHDLSLMDVIARFGDGSKEREEDIRRMYSHVDKDRIMALSDSFLGYRTQSHINFFVGNDQTRCRVIEVWRKESKTRILCHDRLSGDYYKIEESEYAEVERVNAQRVAEQSLNGVAEEDMRLIEAERMVDRYWQYYFLSPQGEVLAEGETPYWHKSHPYSFRIYPFYDGQVFPFVSDFIDQQKYINRLITLDDFVRRASAKGVLAIHEDSIPDGMTVKDFADEWTRFNGVILYSGKAGVPMPQQIVTNSTQLGITDMLQIQLRMLEDVSGVQGALQGRAPNSGTPAALYMQQTQNSATTLTELFEAYRELREDRDMRNLKLIQQFYTEARHINVSGNNLSAMYNPMMVRNTEFDVSITESTATPAHRLVMNDFLMQLFQSGQLTIEELLENGAFPFADKLLQSIRTRMEQQKQAQQMMMQGQMPTDANHPMVSPDVQAELDANTQPIVQQMLSQENGGGGYE